MNDYPRGPLEESGDELTRRKLSLYTRYSELMDLQEAALDDGDLSGFETLDEELMAIQGQIGLPPDDASALTSGPQDGMRAEAIELLRKAQATHARIQGRLASLKDETGSELRQLVRGNSPARQYLEASTPRDEQDAPHFDVTL